MESYTQLPFPQNADETIRTLHAAGTLYRDIADAIGWTVGQVRHYCSRHKLRRDPARWTEADFATLRAYYEERAGGLVDLHEVARLLGRSHASVAIKASRLGLGDSFRHGDPRKSRAKYQTVEERRAATSAARKAWIAQHGHPRGALGLKHSEKTRALLSQRVNAYVARSTHEERQANARKSVNTKIEKYGTGNPAAFGQNAYSRVNRGYAEDLPGLHFRSQWEANYARYLDWLKDKGEITDWAYESERFIFHGVTKAPVTYTPDFKVTENSGAVIYHEVKGWMDGPSKSKLKRMAKFYPDVAIIVIGESEYKAIAKWASLIPFWGDPVKERGHDDDE